MEYKGHQIAEKINVAVSGANMATDLNGIISSEDMKRFVDECDAQVNDLESRGFNVKHVEYFLDPSIEYDDENSVVTVEQIIYREETDMESKARIEDEKKMYDHCDKVWEARQQHIREKDTLAAEDEEYCRWRYHMNILSRYGHNTMDFNTWKEKNKNL